MYVIPQKYLFGYKLLNRTRYSYPHVYDEVHSLKPTEKGSYGKTQWKKDID